MNYNKESSTQNLYAWDFILSDGDTIKEKMFDLFSKVCNFCVRPVVNQIPVTVTCSKEMRVVLTVSAVRGNIEFINKFQKLENGTIWAGQLKRSFGKNGYCTDFDLYEDPNAKKDEIIVCFGDQISILKIFNYPFVE
jgi:hypothetical protein